MNLELGPGPWVSPQWLTKSPGTPIVYDACALTIIRKQKSVPSLSALTKIFQGPVVLEIKLPNCSASGNFSSHPFPCKGFQSCITHCSARVWPYTAVTPFTPLASYQGPAGPRIFPFVFPNIHVGSGCQTLLHAVCVIVTSMGVSVMG